MMVQIRVEAGEPAFNSFPALWESPAATRVSSPSSSDMVVVELERWTLAGERRRPAIKTNQKRLYGRSMVLEPEIKEWAVAASAHPDDCEHEKTEGP